MYVCLTGLVMEAYILLGSLNMAERRGGGGESK